MQCKGTVFLFGAIICGVLVSVPVQAQENCRTAGFWGTHAGVEKNNSTNITEEVMRAHMSSVEGIDYTQTDKCVLNPDLTVTCNFDPPGPAGSPKDCRQAKKDEVSIINLFPPGVEGLSICGQVIDVKDPSSSNIASAIQALCVSPNDDSRHQLARQLTAASLNCIASSGGPACEGISIGAVFTSCNTDCADPNTQSDRVSLCIEQVDCFNNGGVWNDTDPTAMYCQTDVANSCPLQPLVFTLEPDGPILQ